MKPQRVVQFHEFKPSANLEKLKMLTEHLAPRLSERILVDEGNVVEIKMDEGVGVAFGLLNEPAIAVARTTVSAGSKFPMHSHDERELMIVYQGKLVVTVDDKETTMGVGDSIVICPGSPHCAYTDVDTKFICAVVPSSAGFPRAD